MYEFKISNDGIPDGKRLITEAEIIELNQKSKDTSGNPCGLKNLEPTIPKLRDKDGNSGSRKWFLFQKKDGSFGKIDKDSNQMTRCQGIAKSTILILITN
jgi:hypothetical protein